MDCNSALYDARGRVRVRSQTRKLQSAYDELAAVRKDVRRRLHSDFEGARTLPSFLAESAATLAYAREHGYVPTPDASLDDSDAERDTSDAASDAASDEDAASSVSSDDAEFVPSDTASAVSCSDDAYSDASSDASSVPLCVGGVKRAFDAADAVACQLRAAVSAFSASQLRKPGNTTVLQAIDKALKATQPAPGTAHTVWLVYEALLAALDACLSSGRLADVAEAHRQLGSAAQRFLPHGAGSRVVLDDRELQGLRTVLQAVTKAIQQPAAVLAATKDGRPRLYVTRSKARRYL